jgi:hypothetical protein
MEKTARKPSADPAQEKLRQNKALWNKDVSAFVNDLIHLKKLMNGWPSKFFKERSRIGEAMPADPGTIIGSLAADFQDIAQRGNSLVAEQLEYSKTRRKKQPKAPAALAPEAGPATPAPTPPAPGTPDLTKQLAAWETKYQLVAQGSNPVSRFFTKLLTPTMGTSEAARVRRARMAMLNACARTYKDLGKLQVEVVKSSKSSIPAAFKKLNEAWNSWVLVARGFTIYKSSMPAQVADPGGEIALPPELEAELDDEKAKEKREEREHYSNPLAEPSDELKDPGSPRDEEPSAPPEPSSTIPNVLLESLDADSAKRIISDYKAYAPLYFGIGPPELMELGNLIDSFKTSPKQNKSNIVNQMSTTYGHLVSQLNSELGTSGLSLKEIATQQKAKAKVKAVPPKVAPVPSTPPAVVTPPVATPEPPKTASAELNKVAQDFLKKWYGKTMHQLSLFDSTSSYRLDIYKMAGEIRKSLDQIMDLLEKGMDVDQLDPLIKSVNKEITSLRGMTRALQHSGV